MRILEFQAENFKRLTAVEITPRGDVVEIVGKNGAGKSSVLDAIWAVLAGKGASPDLPIRKGKENATARLDLGDYVVVRRWTAKGSTISVENPDGSVHRSPQAILDGLLGRVAFDPLSFVREDGAKQAETLRRLAGLDFCEIEAAIESARSERKEVGRLVKILEGQLAGMAYHDDAPTEEVSRKELTSQLEAIQERRRAFSEANRRVGELRRKITLNSTEAERIKQQIVALQAKLEQVESANATAESSIQTLDEWLLANESPDPSEVQEKLTAAEIANEKFKVNQRWHAAETNTKNAKADYDAWTEQVKDYEAKKAAMLAAARFPVPGLTIEGDAVLLDGVPLEQASGAQQIVLGLAVGAASILSSGSLRSAMARSLTGRRWPWWRSGRPRTTCRSGSSGWDRKTARPVS